MAKEVGFIDPLQIPEKDLPLFVLSDDMCGFIGWGIKAHTSGVYNHIMIMVRPGKLVTQGLMFKEIPVEKYMQGRYRLKFWKDTEMSKDEKNRIVEAVDKDLRQPWWKRRYDFLGVFGQLLRIRWLNNPWTKYCSERVAKYLRILFPVTKHPTPSGLNNLFKKKNRMRVRGYWWAD